MDAGHVNDEFVVGGTTRVLAGFHDKGTAIGKDAFLALKRAFNQFGRGKVVVNARCVLSKQVVCSEHSLDSLMTVVHADAQASGCLNLQCLWSTHCCGFVTGRGFCRR